MVFAVKKVAMCWKVTRWGHYTGLDESPYHQLKRQFGGSRKKRVACTLSWYRMVKVVAGLEQYLYQVTGGTGRVEVMVSYS